MHIEIRQDWTIETLIDLRSNQILRVNHGYQRGLRWTPIQKCMFLDSIFRGYSIPAFYFHLKQWQLDRSRIHSMTSLMVSSE